MEQDEPNLEDGEIEDDGEDDGIQSYTPLERPQTYALDVPQKRFTEVDTRYSESEEEPQSSDSDSDSDSGPHRSKKPKKIKPTPKPLRPQQNKAKKYDIWSTRAQEDVLAETMNSCDVTIKDRSRDVESYDFSLARKYYEELEGRQSSKRTRDDRNNVNFKPRKRSQSKEKEKGKSRLIPELRVDVNCSVEDIAKEVANKLCEEREDLILKVLDAMGKEKTIDIFNETKRIEAEGGMLIMNQTRRRTPGGVFLFLVRHDYHITPEQKQLIFDEEKRVGNKLNKERKKKKLQKIKAETAEARSKILPDLLTRAELFAKQNQKKYSETDDTCTNPPPSPESDPHDSGDDQSPTMESQPLANEILVLNRSLNDSLESTRGKLKTYDDDFLDIGCDNDMDLF